MNDFDEDHDPYDMDLSAPSGSGGGAELHQAAAAGGSPTHTPTARRTRRPRQDSNDGIDGARLSSPDSQQEISPVAGYAAAFDDLQHHQHQHHQTQETAAGGLSLADELGGLGSPAVDEPQYEASSLADEMTRLSTFTVRPERATAAAASSAALDDPDATSGVPRSTHSSHDSTYTNHESNTAAHDDEAAEARARQQEAQLQDLAKSITESVHHTDSFLAKLRGPERPAAAAPGPFISTRGPAHAAQHDIDRLEAVGLAIGTSLRDQAEQRLAQVRELRDIERALSRDDPKLWMALAHVVGSAAVAAAQQVNGDSIEEQDQEEDAMLDLETALAPPAPQDVLGYTRDPPASSSSTTTSAAHHDTSSTTTYDDLRGPSLRSSPLSTHLSHLSHLTTSLNDSLRSVSESLQISAASSREAAKRLRALKKGVDEVRGQEEELERCMRGIEREEMEDQAAAAGAGEEGRRRRRRSEAVKREMEGLRMAFERVEGQVREKGWGKMVGSEVMDGRLEEVSREKRWPEGYRRVVEQFPGVAGLV